MTAPSRLRLIESLLREQGDCSVASLAARCRVSDMTIRRDLAALARAGKAIRTHGGAAFGERVLFEFKFLQRAQLRQPAKEAIGQAAARLVPDGRSVLMDSGTTTLAVAQALSARRDLTIITTSLPIAAALQHSAGVKVLLLGGWVRRDSPDLIGALTERNLEAFRADFAFIGADGIDRKGVLYNQSPEVGRMLARMAAAASATYVVADSSKVGQTALTRFGQLNHWQGLITDAELPRGVARALRRAGVRVLLAESKRNHHSPSPRLA